jgi:hypothetical protein
MQKGSVDIGAKTVPATVGGYKPHIVAVAASHRENLRPQQVKLAKKP